MTDSPFEGDHLLEGDRKAAAVETMFDRIAPRYDLVNRLMTFRLDVRWRRRTVRELALPVGARVLDLACGTGDMCNDLARAALEPVGVDFSAGMLAAARTPAPLVRADALRLPVRTAGVDGVTSGFALRNFADLAGFTTASERLDSADVVALANESLSTLARQIVAEEGYVNKFLGDGLMAFWSAFELQEDQAAKACSAASACTAAIASIEPAMLGVRLGIATGEAIVGDCGAPPDLNDYTAIGDTVNLAARLESANKVFSSRILIDEETMLQAGDTIRSLPLGPIVVFGRSTATRVHALVDEHVTDDAIASATALQRAIEAEDRTAAAECLESMGEFAILHPLAERWAEVVDAGGELVIRMSGK
ncbi:MAG: adenylate/guanylate cyclase domain-containing protein [Phycisphaerales bacterium]|nr:adenylate/guanylate cyclase domain-containing protein [Phycisphaerales bacterium]